MFPHATHVVCSRTINDTLVIFVHIPMKTRVMSFDVDIANFRNKSIKIEVMVRVGMMV